MPDCRSYYIEGDKNATFFDGFWQCRLYGFGTFCNVLQSFAMFFG
jgi:hypothetical protein